jgi:hypothetical protein
VANTPTDDETPAIVERNRDRLAASIQEGEEELQRGEPLVTADDLTSPTADQPDGPARRSGGGSN